MAYYDLKLKFWFHNFIDRPNVLLPIYRWNRSIISVTTYRFIRGVCIFIHWYISTNRQMGSKSGSEASKLVIPGTIKPTISFFEMKIFLRNTSLFQLIPYFYEFASQCPVVMEVTLARNLGTIWGLPWAMVSLRSQERTKSKYADK